MTQNEKYDRCKGALFGLAVGDALGTTNEFKAPEDCIELTDMIGGGPFGLEKGLWTDDTSMALCLAESLAYKDFDLKDQLERYLKWRDEGYLSSIPGHCFDCGTTTWHALSEFKLNGTVITKNTDERTSGNGCIMRLAPVVLKYHDDLTRCQQAAVMQSMTTHGSLECTESSHLMATLLFYMVNEIDTFHVWNYNHPEVDAISRGEYIAKSKDEVFRRGGYVVSSLEFALWCFQKTDNFRDCVLLAANAGGDADTNAAIAGQFAGAFYGFDAIPKEWVDAIYAKDYIEQLVDKLLK